MHGIIAAQAGEIVPVKFLLEEVALAGIDLCKGHGPGIIPGLVGRGE
jgi:hypothetical protein